MMQPVPSLLAAAALIGAGFAGGYTLAGRMHAAEVEHLRGEIASLQARHAAEKQAAAEAAARRLAAAQNAERTAMHALAATRARLEVTNKRLKEALHALPTAGRCGLSTGAVGLLDRTTGSGLPAGAAEPDRAAAGSIADPARPAASEAAVGVWIGDAARAYDECRARIDAIRQWDEAMNGVTHGR